MFLNNVVRGFRHERWDRKMIKTGQRYHQHAGDIVVSRNELMIQLKNNSVHTNLLKLLVYGKSLPDYESRLVRAALKFEFLGSLVFPITENNVDKLPVKVYVKILFQGFYESIDEVKTHIESIVGIPVSNECVKKVFYKLVFIINTCCPVIAETFEIRGEDVYRILIEYAIEHDEYDFPDVDNIWKLFPKNIPQGSVMDYLVSVIPKELYMKIIKEEDNCDHISR